VRALLAGDWRVTGGVLKIARPIWEVGVAGWPVTGRRRGPFSTLHVLRRPALRASTGGVLATTQTQNVSEYMLVLALCLVVVVDANCISSLKVTEKKSLTETDTSKAG